MMKCRGQRKRRRRSLRKNTSHRAKHLSENISNNVLLAKIKELDMEKHNLEMEQHKSARIYREKQLMLRHANYGEQLKRHLEEDLEEWRKNISTMEKATNKLQRMSKKALQETNRLSFTSDQLEEIISDKSLKRTSIDMLQNDIFLHETMIANQDHIIKNLRKQLRMVNKKFDKKGQKISRKANQTKQKTKILKIQCEEYKADIMKIDREHANRSIYCQQHQRLLMERRRERLALPAPKNRYAIGWKGTNSKERCFEDEISEWLKNIQITNKTDK